jgi:hypothetical protein
MLSYGEWFRLFETGEADRGYKQWLVLIYDAAIDQSIFHPTLQLHS